MAASCSVKLCSSPYHLRVRHVAKDRRLTQVNLRQNHLDRSEDSIDMIHSQKTQLCSVLM